MSACPPFSFQQVTPSVWAQLKTKAQELKLDLVADSGSQQRDGFEVEWQYKSDAETLTIHVLNKPWWAPCGEIQRRCNEVIESCQAR